MFNSFAKGNAVVFIIGIEEKMHRGRIFKCSSDSMEREGREIVFLESISGYCYAGHLNLVQVSNDNTFTCDGCGNLHLSNKENCFPMPEICATFCFNCRLKITKETEARKFIDETLSNMANPYIVFENKDISVAGQIFEQEIQTKVDEISSAIQYARDEQHKNPIPRYLVIDTDENPLMVEEIIQLMKKYEVL